MANKKKPSIIPLLPPEFDRIQKLREKFVHPEQEQDRAMLDSWEHKVKKAIIFLSLEGNEGVAMILEKIDLELKELDDVIHAAKPTDLSPEGMAKYSHEQHALFSRRELWEWFRGLFSDARRERKEVNDDLDLQEEQEETAPGL